MKCIQFRRDTATNWLIANPVLLSGELGYDTTNRKIKIGNGVTPWALLPYLCAPCDGLPPIDGSGSLGSGSGSLGSGSGSGSRPSGSITSGSGSRVSGSGSGAFKCGIPIVYEGDKGLFEYMLDLEDYVGHIGIWFTAFTIPDRFSVKFPVDSSGNDLPDTKVYTSGWRGGFDYAGAIGAVSDNDSALIFPRSFGPYWINGQGFNGPNNNAMVDGSLLGNYRQNAGWGYFMWQRASDTPSTRWAKLYVEAPLEDTAWACGVMCNLPLQLPGKVTLDTPMYDGVYHGLHSTTDVRTLSPRAGIPPSPVSPTNPWGTYVPDWEAPFVANANPNSEMKLALGVHSPGFGSAPTVHDWTITATAAASYLDPITGRGGSLSVPQTDKNDQMRWIESLYHPVTGIWFKGQAWTINGFGGETTPHLHGTIEYGEEPPRGAGGLS